MKVQITYISYKEHCELYTEIYGSVTVISCQIELARKDIVLLSNVADFKILDKNNNFIILKVFYLQLLNKWAYTITKQAEFIQI